MEDEMKMATVYDPQLKDLAIRKVESGEWTNKQAASYVGMPYTTFTSAICGWRKKRKAERAKNPNPIDLAVDKQILLSDGCQNEPCGILNDISKPDTCVVVK
jgi:hypothetical protein